jgi:hypothetical protein
MTVPMSFSSSVNQATAMETVRTSTTHAGLGQQGVLTGTMDEIVDPEADAHIDASEAKSLVLMSCEMELETILQSQSVGTKIREGLHKVTSAYFGDAELSVLPHTISREKVFREEVGISMVFFVPANIR